MDILEQWKQNSLLTTGIDVLCAFQGQLFQDNKCMGEGGPVACWQSNCTIIDTHGCVMNAWLGISGNEACHDHAWKRHVFRWMLSMQMAVKWLEQGIADMLLLHRVLSAFTPARLYVAS